MRMDWEQRALLGWLAMHLCLKNLHWHISPVYGNSPTQVKKMNLTLHQKTCTDQLKKSVIAMPKFHWNRRQALKSILRSTRSSHQFNNCCQFRLTSAPTWMNIHFKPQITLTEITQVLLRVQVYFGPRGCAKQTYPDWTWKNKDEELGYLNQVHECKCNGVLIIPIFIRNTCCTKGAHTLKCRRWYVGCHPELR